MINKAISIGILKYLRTKNCNSAIFRQFNHFYDWGKWSLCCVPFIVTCYTFNQNSIILEEKPIPRGQEFSPFLAQSASVYNNGWSKLVGMIILDWAMLKMLSSKLFYRKGCEVLAGGADQARQQQSTEINASSTTPTIIIHGSSKLLFSTLLQYNWTRYPS